MLPTIHTQFPFKLLKIKDKENTLKVHGKDKHNRNIIIVADTITKFANKWK
jgi:hypothetical protein